MKDKVVNTINELPL